MGAGGSGCLCVGVGGGRGGEIVTVCERECLCVCTRVCCVCAGGWVKTEREGGREAGSARMAQCLGAWVSWCRYPSDHK